MLAQSLLAKSKARTLHWAYLRTLDGKEETWWILWHGIQVTALIKPKKKIRQNSSYGVEEENAEEGEQPAFYAFISLTHFIDAQETPRVVAY